MSATTRQAAAKPIKVGTWRRDFAGLQERRMKPPAVRRWRPQAEVARTFGVSAQAASTWYRRWRQGGEAARRGPGRPPPRLSQAELEAVDQALRKGPQAFGFDPTCGPLIGSRR
jgi:hypothetical protein